MERAESHPLPACDPIAGGPLVITEIEAVESGVTIRGRFEVPRFARLNPDQARYLETFLRCRGMLNSVERELGISYPTARGRLDAVLKALDLHAVREDGPSTPEPPTPLEEPAGDEFETQEPSLWEPISEPDEPGFEEPAPKERPQEPRRSRDELLTLLEKGEITVEEMKRELGMSK